MDDQIKANLGLVVRAPGLRERLHILGISGYMRDRAIEMGVLL